MKKPINHLIAMIRVDVVESWLQESSSAIWTDFGGGGQGGERSPTMGISSSLLLPSFFLASSILVYQYNAVCF